MGDFKEGKIDENYSNLTIEELAVEIQNTEDDMEKENYRELNVNETKQIIDTEKVEGMTLPEENKIKDASMNNIPHNSETNKQVQDQISLKFTDLPDLPMRMILKLLRHVDRANLTLRLVSKSVKQVVDSHIELVWLFEGNRGYQMMDQLQMLDESDRNIIVDVENLPRLIQTKRFLGLYSQRIVSFSAPMWPFHYIDLQKASPFQNLKHLDLFCTELYEIDGVEMPSLKKLIIMYVDICEDCAVSSLLHACSSTLEDLKINQDDDDESLKRMIDLSSIRNFEMSMKSMKKLDLEGVSDLTALLSECSQHIEYLRLEGLFDLQKESSLSTLDFPKLKILVLNRVELRPPLLSLLCSPGSLEQVNLQRCYLSSSDDDGQVDYNVTTIKLLEIETYKIEDEANLLSTFKFLRRCAARTETIVVNNKTVDYSHLSRMNISMFKMRYIENTLT